MGCRRVVRYYELLPETERDIYLLGDDPYDGEAVGINFAPSKLFKHPPPHGQRQPGKYVPATSGQSIAGLLNGSPFSEDARANCHPQS